MLYNITINLNTSNPQVESPPRISSNDLYTTLIVVGICTILDVYYIIYHLISTPFSCSLSLLYYRAVGTHEKEIMKMCDENLFSLEFLSSQLKDILDKDVEDEGEEEEEEVEVDEEVEADVIEMDEDDAVAVEEENNDVYQDDEQEGEESEEEIEAPVVEIKKKTKKNSVENLTDQSAIVTPILPDKKKKKRKQEEVVSETEVEVEVEVEEPEGVVEDPEPLIPKKKEKKNKSKIVSDEVVEEVEMPPAVVKKGKKSLAERRKAIEEEEVEDTEILESDPRTVTKKGKKNKVEKDISIAQDVTVPDKTEKSKSKKAEKMSVADSLPEKKMKKSKLSGGK